MTILWITLAFVVGMAAGGMFIAAAFLAAATRATRAQQDQLTAAYRAGLGGSR
jgi:flagellar basal body-associated protein FliL